MATSTVLNGTFFDIKLRTSSGPDVYTLFTKTTNFNLNETRAEIDVSSKSDGGNFQAIPGQYKSDFTVDGFIVDADATTAVIESEIRGAGTGRVRRFQDNVEVEQADFVYTSFTRTGGNEEAVTYSMSGTICGQFGAVV